MINIISDRRRIFEIIAVVITGIGKILFLNILKLHAVFILSAIVFWGIYFYLRVSKHKSLIHYWGLSVLNIRETFKIVGTVGIIAICFFFLYGFYYNTIMLSWNLVFVLILYPTWGLVQQFLLMSLFAGNMMDFQGRKLNYYFVILVTSLLFSVVHYPYLPLIGATFLMALFYSVIFLKYRNIIPLGLFHGILGGLFYYFILKMDTWSIFISIFHNE